VRTRAPVFRPSIVETASLDELTAKLGEFAAIKSSRANVRLQVSITTADRTKVTEYPEAGGVILIRRPSSIRVRASFPVLGTPVFDMTSDGEEFHVYLPREDRFLSGKNKFTTRSEKRVENVRPQHILEALMIDPPREDETVAFLRNDTYGVAAYHIVVLKKKGRQALSRELWFDRAALKIARQTVYEENGDLATDVWYSSWLEGEPPFPGVIRIDRPKDGYQLRVSVLEPGVNEDVPAKSFVLTPPEGVKIEDVGATTEEVLREGGEE
jgi:outer membrane lipoprotein-sorting protein